MPELAKYKNDPVLLKPVGRFAPLGDDPVFDLGGNAAEWVEVKNGNKIKGKGLGGSADRPSDKSIQAKPLAHYTGFRVVKMNKKTK